MKGNRVFISAVNIKAPSVLGIDDLFSSLSGNNPVVFRKEIASLKEEFYLSEKMDLLKSPFYPSRSNEKVMRSEVVAAVVCAKELIAIENISPEILSETPLYISSGVFVEKQDGDLDWLTKAFSIVVESKTSEEKNRKLNQLLPPLLALRTLTNSAESFVAQSTGLAGNNTTFGNTSQSAYATIKEGCKSIQTGESEMAMVGGANRGGVSSYYLHKSFHPNDNSMWKESTAATFLLLESEKSLKSRNKKPLCEIIELESSKHIPKIFDPKKRNVTDVFSNIDSTNEMCIIGGAFREQEYLQDKSEAEKKWNEVFSLFPLFGNLGSTGLFMNIAAALYFFNHNKNASIDCLDKDVYDRFSKITLKKMFS